MRRKVLLLLFGALALVQLRTLHVKVVWMWLVPIVPMAFGAALLFQDFRAWQKKRREGRNFEEGPDDR